MRTWLTCAVLAAILAAVPLYAKRGARTDSPQHSLRVIRLTMRDGSSRVGQLDGVGCEERICSRVAVNTRLLGNVIANPTHFADIAAIRAISDATATFVLKDGTTRQLSVVPDNRVLYVLDAHRRTQKIDLRRVVSVDFNAPVNE